MNRNKLNDMIALREFVEGFRASSEQEAMKLKSTEWHIFEANFLGRATAAQRILEKINQLLGNEVVYIYLVGDQDLDPQQDGWTQLLRERVGGRLFALYQKAKVDLDLGDEEYWLDFSKIPPEWPHSLPMS